MLTEILTEIRNYFCVSEYVGSFNLSNKTITLNNTIVPKVGQYIYINSALNRSICKVTSVTNNAFLLDSDTVLSDDEITYIALLKIPPQIISLSNEIMDWQTKNGNTSLISESFAGWSGTRAQGKNGNLTWKEMFGDRLKPWRRMFADVSQL